MFHSRRLIALLTLIIPPVVLAEDKSRTDAYGDPLPPGAIARLGTTRSQFASDIAELTLSPDGETLAVASDESITLMEPATGSSLFQLKRERTLPGPSVTYSAAGSEFYTLNIQGDIDVYSVATAKKLRTLNLPDDLPLMLRIRYVPATNRLLLWTTHDHNESSMSAWVDPQTGEITRIKDFPGQSIGVSADGKTLLGLRKWDGCLLSEIWARAETGKLQRLAEIIGVVTATTFDEKGQRIALSTAGNVSLLDVKTGRLSTHRFEGEARRHEPWAVSLAFVRAGSNTVLWIGDNLGQIRRLVCDSDEWLPLLSAHDLRVMGLQPLKDGKRLISASRDGVMRTWDIVKGEEVEPRREFRRRVSAALSSDGRRVATADGAGRVWIWDVPTARVTEVLHHFGAPAAVCRWSSKGDWLAVARNNGTIDVWHFRDGRAPVQSGFSLDGATVEVTAMAVIPYSDRLVVGTATGGAQGFKVATRRRLRWGDWPSPIGAKRNWVAAAEDRVVLSWARASLG